MIKYKHILFQTWKPETVWIGYKNSDIATW